ncbi:phosphotransferase [Dermatophilaceae bacterium Sec6.4]
MGDVEARLTGGMLTDGVVRVGNTVRRPMGDHSDLVHTVLRHLEQVGFTGAPRFLGVDEQGREMLTFVEGEVAGQPWPQWVADDDRAASVARLLRALDDAMRPLGLPAGTSQPVSWPGVPDRPGPPPSFLGHRDVAPENVVFRAGRAVSLIDFDLVRASSTVDEVTNLLVWWGGWAPPADREDAIRDLDPASRGRLLVDAYGLDDQLRQWVVPVAISTAQRTWYSMENRARTQGGGWATMWSDGIGDRIHRREQWLRDNEHLLIRAITT